MSALRVSMISSLTQNNGAWGSKYAKLWRYIGRWCICVMRKLDKVKIGSTQTFDDVLEKIRKEDYMNKFSIS